MAGVNKPKLQLRSGLSINGDKTPSPASKLLISHGKPNFTIPRSYKIQNGNASPTSPPATPPSTTAGSNFQNKNINNNNEFVVKSTTFNGVFKPSNISVATKQTLPQNGNAVSQNGNDNEAAKVVLRRPRVVQTEMGEREDDDNVPEFIRRQRRIQERLANQNILDFENRRSGYFTQVMISPTSPNRQSFVETMASPAVKPGLEMPSQATQQEDIKIESISEEQKVEPPPQQEQHQLTEVENGRETVNLNGQVEEEEVAKAIEEVNKAVEGEDDDKTELEDQNKISQHETKEVEISAAAELKLEESQPKKEETQSKEITALENSTAENISVVEPNVSSVSEVTPQPTTHEKVQDEAANVSVPVNEEKVEEARTNGHVVEEHQESVLLKSENLDSGITISHVNGINGPSIPAPDPSGEKGVNFETKTVVSFSQELGNGDNKYPDTVKVVKDGELSEADSDLKELTKLKFEIKADNQDIEVKPVLVKETA